MLILDKYTNSFNVDKLSTKFRIILNKKINLKEVKNG